MNQNTNHHPNLKFLYISVLATRSPGSLVKKEETIPTSNPQKQVCVIQTFKLM